MYRGTWLLVGIPLLVAAFTLGRATPLPPPALPPTFDRDAARALALELARDYPDRSPGTPGAARAADWVARQLRQYGLEPQRERFVVDVPGRGGVPMVNLIARVPGRSRDEVVVVAHRDNLGTGPGANDNASGTAALLELARGYARLPADVASGATSPPATTLVFVSTDGGSLGGLGAAQFASTRSDRERVAAVVSLDAIAGRGRPRIELAGAEPRSPAPNLVETAAVRLLEATGRRPERPSTLDQLIDLGFPFSVYEQAPFVGRGVPAVTITTNGERPSPSFADAPGTLNGLHLAQIGRAAETTLGSLEQGLELDARSAAYVYFGPRILRGWAVQLVLVAALLPFLAAVVDLFARVRRHRIPLAPALRSLRSRVAFWLFVGAVFALFAALGAWPTGVAHPPRLDAGPAVDWTVAPLAAALVIAAAGWLVVRERLVPRRPVTDLEHLSGSTAALLAAGVLALVVVPLNAFSLLFVLPSLHAWLWLPQARDRPAWLRLVIVALGFVGPALIVTSFAVRFGLGLDTPWYLLTLVSIGYVGLPAVLVTLVWTAVAAQLASVAAGRYAPYPTARERPRLGPIRRTIGRLIAAGRRMRRRTLDEDREAATG
jgi:hypothetical protein